MRRLLRGRRAHRPSRKSSRGEGVRVAFPERLRLGEGVYLGDGVFLQAQGGIEIGDRTVLGSRVVVLSHNHNYAAPEHLPYDEKEILRPVRIGRYVWIGMGAMICPGVSVGEGAVVRMGAVVSRDVPAMAIVAGNPATEEGRRGEEALREYEKKSRKRETDFPGDRGGA